MRFLGVVLRTVKLLENVLFVNALRSLVLKTVSIHILVQ